MSTMERNTDDSEGILLYYKYVEISDIDEIMNWFKDNCSSLNLLGRVRVSPEGINVTVGGKLESLKKHIAAVDSKPLFTNCDFKLAKCDDPVNQEVAKECGFSSLSVRAVKDVVSLFSHPPEKMPSLSNCGKHLSPAEFHSALQISDDSLSSSASAESNDVDQASQVVLIDARNAYETRIGKFVPPKGVQTLVPNIRQYSDLPAWIDSHEEQLRGNQLLMYCTGGVRCEMASAYIKMKGPEYKNVYQLSGGIQRYLEAYPDGGFFKGKNFVFDHRISVGSGDREVVGSCLICNQAFDDYSSRCRCTYCRMLVLVCAKCQEHCTLKERNPIFICELCRKNGHSTKPSENSYNNGFSKYGLQRGEEKDIVLTDCCTDEITVRSEEVTVEQTDLSGINKGPLSSQDYSLNKLNPTKKLKILCLHGFRQNAAGFKGRFASFSKKLKNLADFVFVDAPHQLNFVYQPLDRKYGSNVASCDSEDSCTTESHTNFPQICKQKYAWLIAPSCLETHVKSSDLDLGDSLNTNHLTESSQQGNHVSEETSWVRASLPFDPLQYQQQTAGWPETITYIEEMFSKSGPFDGILGFSQGASVAATLCALKQNAGSKLNTDFKFAIFCSGFPSPAEEFQNIISQPSMLPINCPSLHIFGGLGENDRQIPSDASMQLASYFNSDNRVIMKHSLGHIVPTKSPYIDNIREFLCQFI